MCISIPTKTEGGFFCEHVQGCIQQVTGEKVVEIVREEKDLLLLPQDLWCSLQESKDGERLLLSVGWLFEPGHALTSTCIFSSDSKLEVTIISLLFAVCSLCLIVIIYL